MKIVSAEEFRADYNFSEIKLKGEIPLYFLMQEYSKYLLEKQAEYINSKVDFPPVCNTITEASTEFINQLNETK